MGLLKQNVNQSGATIKEDEIPFVVDRTLISEVEGESRIRRRAAIACALWLSRSSQFSRRENSSRGRRQSNVSFSGWGKR